MARPRKTSGSQKRTTRARAVNPTTVAPPAPTTVTPEELAGASETVQRAIDGWGEVSDAVPHSEQMDRTNLSREVALADPPDPFEATYERARARGLGHLARMRASSGRSTLIPPNAELHPKLGRWAINRRGKWLIIRWIGIRQVQRQKRYEQGYQYFEGREQCKEIGLDPEVYMNDRNRIQIGDAELGWVPEEFVYEHMMNSQRKKEEMVQKAEDHVMKQVGKVMPDMRIFEGSEEEVTDRLKALKGGSRYA
jgi:hypothetical protein